MSEKMQECMHCGASVPEDAMQEHTARCLALDRVTERVFGREDMDDPPDRPDEYGDDGTDTLGPP